jgi:hypothetical protein
MSDRIVWVELLLIFGFHRVVRIFRSEKAAFASGLCLMSMTYSDAVSEIRHQIFIRSRGYCELCGTPVVEASGHMHEKKHRGKGGEISLDNSVFICVACHKREHRSRAPQFTRRQS